ncbi:MAG: hypothetical protein GF346_09320 [Candidatus Eisenbacteria bacterium]|nr:hypothetical protein [Candidatus Latescibacterota bacterium]MBD3302631.1 hypothetical protein [Candidatus Eisenbacteria bacterium]
MTFRNHVPEKGAAGRRPRRVLAALGMLGAILIASTTTAQGEPPWDRKVHAIAVLPGQQGDPALHDIHVAWTVSALPLSAPVDLSTEITLEINGVAYGTPIDRPIDLGYVGLPCEDVGGCSGWCGDGTVDGQDAVLNCYEDCPNHSNPDLPPDCDCGVWFDETFPSIPLAAGDEVLVLLRPAPGALPDDDTENDTRGAVYHGGPIYWNRSVETVHLIETPGAPPDVYDVSISGLVSFDGQNTLNLDMEIELLRNGTPLATDLLQQRIMSARGPTCFQVGCGSYCGTVNGIPRNCDPVHFQGCGCGAGWLMQFPGVPIPDLQPDEEILAILRPAPGALPEPWSSDDRILWDPDAASIAPVDGGGSVRLEQNRPNPFRPETSIRFRLDAAGPVAIEIFSPDGRRVRELVDRPFEAGTWMVTWDGRTDEGAPAAAGTYFYRMTAQGRSETRKMLRLDR